LFDNHDHLVHIFDIELDEYLDFIDNCLRR